MVAAVVVLMDSCMVVMGVRGSGDGGGSRGSVGGGVCVRVCEVCVCGGGGGGGGGEKKS
jgi:hypothetical protein